MPMCHVHTCTKSGCGSIFITNSHKRRKLIEREKKLNHTQMCSISIANYSVGTRYGCDYMMYARVYVYVPGKVGIERLKKGFRQVFTQ